MSLFVVQFQTEDDYLISFMLTNLWEGQSKSLIFSMAFQIYSQIILTLFLTLRFFWLKSLSTSIDLRVRLMAMMSLRRLVCQALLSVLMSLSLSSVDFQIFLIISQNSLFMSLRLLMSYSSLRSHFQSQFRRAQKLFFMRFISPSCCYIDLVSFMKSTIDLWLSFMLAFQLFMYLVSQYQQIITLFRISTEVAQPQPSLHLVLESFSFSRESFSEFFLMAGCFKNQLPIIKNLLKHFFLICILHSSASFSSISGLVCSDARTIS